MSTILLYFLITAHLISSPGVGTISPCQGIATEVEQEEHIETIEVYAIANGKVVSVSIANNEKTVTIEHTSIVGKITSKYKKLDENSVTVDVGDVVRRGEKIGETSSIEGLLGPRLDFKKMKKNMKKPKPNRSCSDKPIWIKKEETL